MVLRNESKRCAPPPNLQTTHINRPFYIHHTVRCNNAMQCMACICSLAACFIEELRDGAKIINQVCMHVDRCEGRKDTEERKENEDLASIHPITQ